MAHLPREEPYAVRRALDHVRGLSDGPRLDPTLRVTLNFHPDRLVRGVPLLQVMAQDGVYRSQFETGTSNGGLTARPGGARWLWESRIFGGAYDDAEPSLRPKYGALDLHRRGYGAAPRFGSAHVRLAAQAARADDVLLPRQRLRARALRHRNGFRAGGRCGCGGRSTCSTTMSRPRCTASSTSPGMSRQSCSTRATAAPTSRPTLAGSDLRWSGTPATASTSAPCAPTRDFRGPDIVALGESLAEEGVVTPQVIGAAARSGQHDEQALKRVWHYVARFGQAPS